MHGAGRVKEAQKKYFYADSKSFQNWLPEQKEKQI